MDVAALAVGADPCANSLVLTPQLGAEAWQALTGLDAWFETMRLPGGYGGPVVHWWRDCLDYTGPGLDWRYEGIIIGCLDMWTATRDSRWLAKAQRAGDDLVAGQLPSGNYRNSEFELNPGAGGTPHEAACDLALLRLASALRDSGASTWTVYLCAAERNLKEYFVGRLWDERARSFRDTPDTPSLVPNKVATLAEALFVFSRLTGESVWAERYALQSLDAVLAHQITGGDLDGAIYQNSFGLHRVAKFFPFYVARCIPGLLEGLTWSKDARYADAARRAASFILSWRYEDGSFPQVIYPRRRINRYPQWVAGAADILRALDLARSVGVEFDDRPTLCWLLAGRREDGAFRTAVGFGRAKALARTADYRDGLGVCGWSDKMFRYLANLVRTGRVEPA